MMEKLVNTLDLKLDNLMLLESTLVMLANKLDLSANNLAKLDYNLD